MIQVEHMRMLGMAWGHRQHTLAFARPQRNLSLSPGTRMTLHARQTTLCVFNSSISCMRCVLASSIRPGYKNLMLVPASQD